jgi:hypothetical protein
MVGLTRTEHRRSRSGILGGPMDATAGLREYRRRVARAAAAGVVSFLVVVFLTDRFGAMADAVTAFGAMGLPLVRKG